MYNVFQDGRCLLLLLREMVILFAGLYNIRYIRVRGCVQFIKRAFAGQRFPMLEISSFIFRRNANIRN